MNLLTKGAIKTKSDMFLICAAPRKLVWAAFAFARLSSEGEISNMTGAKGISGNTVADHRIMPG